MKKKMKLGRLIKKLHFGFHAQFNNVVKEYDLTGAQSEILIYLEKNSEKSITQRDIENYFGISNPTVSGLISRLEEKKLVERVACKKDARFKYIKLTKKAIVLLDNIKDALDTNDIELRKCLTKEEDEQLYYLLEKLLDNVEKRNKK